MLQDLDSLILARMQPRPWWEKEGDSAAQSKESLAQCVHALGVKHLVIGHAPAAFTFADKTTRARGDMAQHFEGLIFFIDVGMSRAVAYSNGAILHDHSSCRRDDGRLAHPGVRKARRRFGRGNKELIPMKFWCVLIGAVLLGASVQQASSAGDKETLEKTEYFPLKVGNTWEYQVNGKKIVTTWWQPTTSSATLLFARLDTNMDGSIVTEHVTVRLGSVIRLVGNGQEPKPPVVLKVPPKVGDKWDLALQTLPIQGSLLVLESKKLKVGDKEYDTVLVISSNLKYAGQDVDVKTWYAEGRGHGQADADAPRGGPGHHAGTQAQFTPEVTACGTGPRRGQHPLLRTRCLAPSLGCCGYFFILMWSASWRVTWKRFCRALPGNRLLEGSCPCTSFPGR